MRHRVRAVCLLAEDIHLSDSEIAQQVQILHDPANFTKNSKSHSSAFSKKNFEHETLNCSTVKHTEDAKLLQV